MIEAHRGQAAVESLRGALGVSVSGYYAWRKREPSQQERKDEELLVNIVQIYEDSRGLYGSPRIHAALRQQGIRCSRKRVARLMRDHKIYSKRRPKRRVRTTDSRHNRPVAPNLLGRDFSADAPNQKWVGDIIGIWTQASWLYLAAILDTYSRRIVGWAMSQYRDEDLVTQALQMALGWRDANENLIHHTDRGSQYTAQDYQDLLATYGIQVSMSRKGDCYDNAMIESFFSTLRSECTDLQDFQSHQQARLVIFNFIEVFYNRQRLHSSLDYTSPVTYENSFFKQNLSLHSLH